MLLTFKVKHNQDFSGQLDQARKVAGFAIETGSKSSKDVKHFGLPSAISNQVLRKYGRCNAKKVSNPILPVPGQSLRYEDGVLTIPCLKLSVPFTPHREIEKVNQVEIGKEFAFISCTVKEPETIPAQTWIGVDLNTTGHCAVVANPQTGKVIKMGKSVAHIRSKARAVRKRLQKKRKFRRLKAHRNKQKRRILDIEHKISRKIVDEAARSGCGIRMENLSGIRKTTKQAKSFKGALHSWSFFRLQALIEYKAKLRGVPVEKIDPSFTSQADSRTGLLGTRTGKCFVSPTGRVENADANAAFNIALASNMSQLRADRDARKGNLKPLEAQRQRKRGDARTPRL
jgi:putative transposase